MNMSPTQSQAPTEWIDRDMSTHGHDGLGVTLEGTQMVMKYCPDRKRLLKMLHEELKNRYQMK